MQQRPRQVRELPTRLADEIATIVGARTNQPDERKKFRKYLSSIVREAWRGHAVRPRKVPRQGDVTKYLDKLLLDLNALLPEKTGEIAGAFLAAGIVPDAIEDWIEKVERARFNLTENPETMLPTRATRGKHAFSNFLMRFLVAEIIFGFHWTIGWNEHRRRVQGSLIDALDALADYLPDNFIPNHRTLRGLVSKMREKLVA